MSLRHRVSVYADAVYQYMLDAYPCRRCQVVPYFSVLAKQYTGKTEHYGAFFVLLQEVPSCVLFRIQCTGKTEQ